MSGNQYVLLAAEIEKLRSQIKGCRDADQRIRLLCVYWVGQGKTAEWVSNCLLINVRTVFRYLQDYHHHNKSTPGSRGGSQPHLTEPQEQVLKDHLSKTILHSTVEVVKYVFDTFGVRYSRGGIAKWLLRNGFRYKRPHRVPHTVSVEKQEAFVKVYREMKSSLTENEVILFMDGVHPDHQTQAACGWIPVGVNAQIPSTSKQKRLHYMGAVEVTDNKVTHTMKAYETIDSEAVIDFVVTLTSRSHYPSLFLGLRSEGF
jgi:transposase